ncbi:MAG: NmrA family NAD(P)-binding protein [Phenylobacterium sp.]|nr:NmrA family NAD(P)-binding protein [Phenylobacterium sp.]
MIGATGGVGGAVADRLLADGWRVRALNRDPETLGTLGPHRPRVGQGRRHGRGRGGRGGRGLRDRRPWGQPAGLQELGRLVAADVIRSRRRRRAGRGSCFPGTVHNYGEDASR